MRRLASVVALFAFFALPAFATNYFVDSSVGSSGNGLSWATAWKNFSNITGLVAGDVVNFSGGSTTQAYAITSWIPTSGSSGNPITYQVGQDAGHNGIVAVTASGNVLNGDFSNVTINGNVGGAQHMTFATTGYAWDNATGTDANDTLEYLKFSITGSGGGFHFSQNNPTGLTIEFCDINKNTIWQNIRDFVFYSAASTTINIHDNTIELPVWSTDHSIGDDMWIWPQDVNFYNNVVSTQDVSGYTTNCPSGPSSCQHSDIFQSGIPAGGGTYGHIHVYANKIVDPGESVYYEDSQGSGTATDILFYNNLISRTVGCTGTAQRIFDLNPEASPVTYSSFAFSDNDIIDQTDGTGTCNFVTRVSGATTYTNTNYTNNVAYPNGGDATLDAGVTVAHNLIGTTTNIHFVSYTAFAGTSNNLNIQSSSIALIGQGSNMSSYFTTDYAGNTRPASAAWDIGAYQFAAPLNLPAPASSMFVMVGHGPVR